MKRYTLILFFFILVLSSNAQTLIVRDPEIKKMVDEISQENIEQYVRKLVSFHTRHNLSEQNDIISAHLDSRAALDNDSTGFAPGENDSKARQLARYIKETGERYVEQLNVTLVFRNDRFGRGGDHTPFCQEGFTAVRICEYNENYDRTHKIPQLVNGIQEGDLPEYVDYEYVRKNAGINLATIASLALAPYEPANSGIVTGGLTNKTTLKWESPSKGVKPSGYYILMRETFQPLWEKKIFVKGNEVTLPYTKDNYFFGIQSVDAAGHESIVVFPGQAKKQNAANN